VGNYEEKMICNIKLSLIYKVSNTIVRKTKRNL